MLCLLGIGFFGIYSYLIFGNEHLRFSWPDEMAAFFSATQFAEENHLYAIAQHTDIADALVSPRSMLVWQGKLVPIGFLGMPLLWGGVAKAVGTSAILLLTPLLAVLGAYFFYRLLKLYFEESVALLSGILLLLMPAYWYYSSFVMLPNVAMVSLLIIGLFFLASGFKENRPWYFQMLAGLSLGAALIIRPNEVIWILPLVILFLLVSRKNLKFFSFSLFLFFSVIPILLLAIAQSDTYGHWYQTGYSIGTEFTTALRTSHPAQNYLFPFGFEPLSAAKNIFTYVVSTHWLIIILAFVGAFMAIIREKQIAWKVLLGVAVSLSIFLGLMYGSWKLSDDLTLNISRIGVSYNRYLLPALITVLPFVAFLLVRIYRMPAVILPALRSFSVGGSAGREGSRVTAGILISIFLGFLLFAFGFSKVYLQGNDSLPKIKQSIAEYNLIHEKVIELTPDNAVIETFRGDKIVFPERQVVAQYNYSDNSFRLNLMESLPYYILSIENETYQGLSLLLGDVGIKGKRAIKVENLIGKYALYKVVDGEPDSPQPYE